MLTIDEVASVRLVIELGFYLGCASANLKFCEILQGRSLYAALHLPDLLREKMQDAQSISLNALMAILTVLLEILQRRDPHVFTALE